MRESASADVLHQTRVALRRLRSAFSIFKPILIDDEADRIKSELRWLASVLGDARNIDVLIETIEDSNLHHLLTRARKDAYETVYEALQSPRARAVMLDLCAWLTCGEYLRHPKTKAMRELGASQFAAVALDRLRAKIKRHGKHLAKADDEHRHEVRKDAKKLRYGAEFFRSFCETKKSKRDHLRFISLMEVLQDHLGSLNDMVTRRHVLNQLGLDPGDGRQSDASDKVDLQLAAQAALKDLIDIKRFWR